jgi:hypothetical protein
MESKLLELENKIIDLTNDMNRIKASRPELFTRRDLKVYEWSPGIIIGE